MASFTEEPPYELIFKQLPLAAKRIAMALHVHAQEWLSHTSKTSRKILTTKTKRPQPLDLRIENLCLKTSHIWADGVEDEDDELADMVNMTGSFSLT